MSIGRDGGIAPSAYLIDFRHSYVHKSGLPDSASGRIVLQVTPNLQTVSRSHEPLVARHMPELDVVRGAAVVMVLHCHLLAEYPGGSLWLRNKDEVVSALLRAAVATASPLGWLGVQLFFVLSGFLITGILLNTRTQPGFYSTFYARRAVRILPAYLLCVLSLVVLGWSNLGFPVWNAGQVICCLGFAANLMPLFGLVSPYGPLWSLAVEEHFYLLWPTVVRNSGRALGVICVTVLAAEIGLRWLSRSADPSADLTTLTWFNLDGLVMGAVAGLLLRKCHNSARLLVTFALCLSALAVGSFVLLQSRGQLPRATFGGGVFGPTAWSLFFAACILFAVLARSRWPALWVSRWPFGLLRWFGFISYGLYLIHVMIIHLTDHFLGGVIYPAELDSHSVGDMVLRYGVIVALASVVSYLSRISYEQFFLSRKALVEVWFSKWFGRRNATI